MRLPMNVSALLRRPGFGALARIGTCVSLLVLLAATVRWQWAAYESKRLSEDSARAQYVETAWEALVPEGWDPLKRYREAAQGEASDSGAGALELARRMRKTWDNAPLNTALDGAKVTLVGYVVPVQAGRDATREFLLVPYFGACIHVPPPPANQIVHVSLTSPVENIRTMDYVVVSGALRSDRRNSAMGMSGYAMDAVRVEKRILKGFVVR